MHITRQIERPNKGLLSDFGSAQDQHWIKIGLWMSSGEKENLKKNVLLRIVVQKQHKQVF